MQSLGSFRVILPVQKKKNQEKTVYLTLCIICISNACGRVKAHFIRVSAFSSVAQLYLTLCDPMDCSRPGIPVHCRFLEFTQTHVHWVGDAIQPSHPLLSPSPPAFNLFSIRVFSRWPKYWSFNFGISPTNVYSGLISFTMDWLDLLAVQGTPKSLLQHHSSKASILWRSAFFILQLSDPYMILEKR